MGIQALPGTKFYLNDINALNREPIIIGRTGIFELSLNQAKINSIAFDEKSMETINTNENAYLIVDILYEEED